MIGMAAAGAAPHDLESLPGGHALCPFLVSPHLLQQKRGSYAERTGERNQGLQTGSDMAGLEPAQHSGADPGGGRDIRQRQVLAFPDSASDQSQLPADIARSDLRRRARYRLFG